jgi:hypothetical protein
MIRPSPLSDVFTSLSFPFGVWTPFRVVLPVP